jgi:hypothetical protein
MGTLLGHIWVFAWQQCSVLATQKLKPSLGEVDHVTQVLENQDLSMGSIPDSGCSARVGEILEKGTEGLLIQAVKLQT